MAGFRKGKGGASGFLFLQGRALRAGTKPNDETFQPDKHQQKPPPLRMAPLAPWPRDTPQPPFLGGLEAMEEDSSAMVRAGSGKLPYLTAAVNTPHWGTNT